MDTYDKANLNALAQGLMNALSNQEIMRMFERADLSYERTSLLLDASRLLCATADDSLTCRTISTRQVSSSSCSVNVPSQLRAQVNR